MKIAVFTKKTTFHEGYGGLETLNKVLCEGMVKRGHEIVVFSPKWELGEKEKTEEGVKYVFVDCVYRMGPVFGFFGSFQKENWINRSVEWFERYHQKQKFDLVLAQSSAGLGVIKKKAEYGIKAVSISHGSIVGEYKTFVENMDLSKDLVLFIKNTGFTLKNFFRRQREFVHSSNKIVAVSNFVKHSLIEETYVEEEKVEVIYNGVDPEKFFEKETNIRRGKKVLYVGQIIESKGVKDIINIFKDPKLSEFEIDLLGGGDLFDYCKKTVKQNEDLAGRVNFLGKAPYSKLVNDYFKNLDYGLFILPTKRYEGLPMVLIEAMFSGLPIVAYDKGGVSDAVKNSENGFLVEPGDMGGFKKAMLSVLSEDEIINQFGNKSLEMAYEKFTLTKMLDNYEKIINKV